MGLQGHDAPILELRETSGMTLAQLDGYLALVKARWIAQASDETVRLLR